MCELFSMNCGITAVIILNIGFICALSLRQEDASKSVDFSGCTGGHKEISYPYSSDKGGHFITYNIAPSTKPPLTADHLYISIRWRNRVLHLDLSPHQITPMSGVAEWEGDEAEGNVTVVEGLQDGQDDCFYQGQVRGARRSFVAVSLCDGGMTGYIQTGQEGLYLEPLQGKGRREENGSTPHILHSCVRHPARGDNQPINDVIGEFERSQPLKRARRAPSDFTKYIEVLVVADTTVVDFVGKKRIKQYLLGMMNIVNAVYHDDSLGLNIEVVTVKVMYMNKNDESRVVITSDPKRTVDQFCQWVGINSYRNSYYGGGVNHDVSILLSRKKFGPAGFVMESFAEFYCGSQSRQGLAEWAEGYAPITGMCVPMRSCALVKDDGFTSSFVIAHEMAHVIGLMHDGQGNSCYGRQYATSIMATMVQSSFNHYWWSECSRERMKQVIRTLGCLTNNPYTVETETVPLPVGVSWSLDEQCKLEFGERHVHCRYFAYSNPCAKLWCAEGRRTYTCTTKNVVPLDGTQCGHTEKWWCSQGECGYHGNERPVNGGWGEWNAWSSCSNDCGVGFKKRSRKCDNPRPQYGGNDCSGESETTDTCKSEELCDSYEDQRALQCMAMNDMPLPQGKHKWLPYQVTDVRNQCKMTCVTMESNQVVTFDVIVNDGTPCSYDNPYNICLDGTCLEVGCDGVQGSSAQEDICGVCGGDGTSCKTVEGVFTKVFKYSAAGEHYEPVLVLPNGSRNVEISETATLPHFLAVQDTGYNRYVLNGEGVQKGSRNFVLEGAWFQYSNNRGYETLRTKGPLHRDVNVMIYPMDLKQKAGVNYRYTVDKNDYTYEKSRYGWEYESWSECSVTCGQGVQHIIYGCYSKDTDEKVDDEKCQYVDARDSDDVSCERLDCSAVNYRWRMSRNFSECSKSCGDSGMRYQLFDCEQLGTGELVEKYFCTNVPEPIQLEACNRIPCVSTKYKWVVTSEWTECSATCGEEGTQWQRFFCEGETASGEVSDFDDKFCSDLPNPKEPRPCNRVPCESYKWVLSPEWYDCSHECGVRGKQWRKVNCQKSSGNDLSELVDDRNCLALEQPGESRPCNRKPCSRYLWSQPEDWSECSHTCGSQGRQSKPAVCKNITHDGSETVVGDSYCYRIRRPTETRRCNETPCASYKWVPTYTWTNCSVTCGSGYKRRIFECRAVFRRSSQIVEDELCKDQPEVNYTRRCSGPPCSEFYWEVDETWSDCNATCETDGVRIRNAFCLEKFTNGRRKRADDEKCIASDKPATVQICSKENCPSYYWSNTDQWSDCSSTCGESGIQTSEMKCLQDNGEGEISNAEEEHCVNIIKPEPETRACDVPPCIIYRQMEGSDWSDCSVTCGTGVQTRRLECVLTRADGSEERVQDSHCVEVNITKPTRTCEEDPCGGTLLEWGAGPWSMCSRTCGRGQKKRQVYCGNPHAPSDVSRCPGKAPSEYTDCEEPPCDGTRRQCVRDRASFCRKANARLCRHAAYVNVCCKSCQDLPQRSPVNRRRRRRYRNRNRNRGHLRRRRVG